MLLYDRQEKILALMKSKPSVTVDYLCKNVFASPATIRRDLSQMEQRGLVKRVHGGAIAMEGANQDPPLMVRKLAENEKKSRIAKYAKKFIKEGQTLFLDSSSTVTSLAESLYENTKLSVVTNGIDTLFTLNNHPGIKLFTCAGTVTNNSSIIGSMAIDTIRNFHADVLFFSCSGISIDAGVTEGSEDSAALKKQMIKNAKMKILLCDSSKFGMEFFCKTCAFDEIDYIITDLKPSDSFLRGLPNTVKIIY